MVTCEAETQQEADNCASVNWNECVASASQNNPTRIRWPKANTDNQPPDIFFNSEYDFSGTCSDGTPFIFSVPAATFSAFTQAEADAIAQSYAQTESGKLGCLGDLPVEICFGVFTSLSIATTGTGPFDFEIVSGAVPTGMVVQQTSPTVLSVTGTPTAFGPFTFVVQLTNPDGIVLEKSYTINVVGIASNSTIPDANMSVSYLFNFLAGGIVSGAVQWSIVSGSLPPGLVLSTNGSLSGIPTQTGHYSFVVQMQDSNTSCRMVCSLNVKPSPPCVALIDANVFANDGGNFIPQTLTATEVGFQMPQDTPTGGLLVNVDKNITNNTGSPFTVTVTLSWNAANVLPPYSADITNNGHIAIVVDGLIQFQESFYPANLAGSASFDVVVADGQTILLGIEAVGIQGFGGVDFSQGAVSGTANLTCH